MQSENAELVTHIDECVGAVSAARAGIAGGPGQSGASPDVLPWQLSASLEALRTGRRHLDVAYSMLLERALNEESSHGGLGLYREEEA